MINATLRVCSCCFSTLRVFFGWIAVRFGLAGQGAALCSKVVAQAAGFLLIGLVLFPSPAAAVVILNATGQTANNGQVTQPIASSLPYENVGLRGAGGASVTYLGNQWAITANHVSLSSGGEVVLYTPSQSTYVDYTVDNTVQLYNTDGTPTDLKLVHITSNPGLPSLNIATSAPPNGPATPTPITMIGAGEDLGTQQTYTYGDTNYTGYNLLSSEGVPRWGTNVINDGSVGYSP